jgi:hypothetical protein
MVRVLASIVVDRGFENLSGETKDYEIDLSVIMRSLGNSPTKVEISKYFSKYGPGKNNHDNLLKNIYIYS